MSQDGPIERELKFPCRDLNSLRDRLLEMSAERVAASGFEENWIFDHQGELKAAGCLLRLRKDTQGSYIAFKGPMSFEGHTRIRIEQETGIDSSETMHAILEALGYQVERRYQKMREEWRLGGVTVALDHTPIGDYVEFEGEAAERVARRFGFEPAKAERRSYVRLYEDHRATNPDAPDDMVFPDRG